MGKDSRAPIPSSPLDDNNVAATEVMLIELVDTEPHLLVVDLDDPPSWLNMCGPQIACHDVVVRLWFVMDHFAKTHVGQPLDRACGEGGHDSTSFNSIKISPTVLLRSASISSSGRGGTYV